MAAIHRVSGKPTLRTLLCLCILLSGASAQTPGAGTTPKVAIVSPAVGQQSSAAPQGTGGASTAQASPAPQGASTVPAGSNVTNQPTTVATGKPGACRPNPSPMPGEFVKQCEQDGSFSTKQCHGSTGFCYCAHPQDGTIYQETGRRGSMQHDCATYWKTKGTRSSLTSLISSHIIALESLQSLNERGQKKFGSYQGTGETLLDFVQGQNTGAVVVAAIGCILTLLVVIFVVFGEIRGINFAFFKNTL